MYEIEYNKEMKKYGVYRSAPYLNERLLCAIFDDIESAILYVVDTIQRREMKYINPM